MKKLFLLAGLLISLQIAYAQALQPEMSVIIKLSVTGDAPGSKLRNQDIIINTGVEKVSKDYGTLGMRRLFTGRSGQNIYVARFPEGTAMEDVISAYYATGEIEYAELDHMGTVGGVQAMTPNDQYYSRQWGLKNDGSFSLMTAVAGADVEMENAWDIETGDTNIIVAIIDTGNKLDHSEFTGRIWYNFKETKNGIDDDNNGLIDDIRGWDFAYNDNNPTDDNGHGTNVTGIIGANGFNLDGYAGVDLNCKLMSLKALDGSSFGQYTWFAEAIYYAVDNGAKVINMSLGGSSTSQALKDAIAYAISKKVVPVVCMMNTNSNTTYYPAAYPGVIAVGSTNPNDTRTSPFFWSTTSGSNYGNHISVVAPGNYIYGLSYTSNTNYGSYWGGTSQATPLVAGIASLLLAQDSSRTPAQIKSLIEQTAEDQVGKVTEDVKGWDRYYGYGRVNAFRALQVGASSINYVSTVKWSNLHASITASTINLPYQVKNKGLGDGKPSITSFYWSLDSLFDSGDKEIHTANESAILAGDSINPVAAITYPGPLKQSRFYVFYKTDSRDSVKEASENDNMGVIRVTFDDFKKTVNYIATNKVTDIHTFVALPSFNVPYYIKNTGNSGGKPTVTSFYWSPDSTHDIGDIEIRTASADAIASDDSLLASTLSVIYPGPAKQKKYFLFYKTDSRDSIKELSETDNVGVLRVIFDDFKKVGINENNFTGLKFYSGGRTLFIQSSEQGGTAESRIRIYNALGQEVYTSELMLQNGLTGIFLPENLDGGVYCILLENGRSRVSGKFILE
jgi:thermitase